MDRKVLVNRNGGYPAPKPSRVYKSKSSKTQNRRLPEPSSKSSSQPERSRVKSCRLPDMPLLDLDLDEDTRQVSENRQENPQPQPSSSRNVLPAMMRNQVRPKIRLLLTAISGKPKRRPQLPNKARIIKSTPRSRSPLLPQKQPQNTTFQYHENVQDLQQDWQILIPPESLNYNSSQMYKF